MQTDTNGERIILSVTHPLALSGVTVTLDANCQGTSVQFSAFGWEIPCETTATGKVAGHILTIDSTIDFAIHANENRTCMTVTAKHATK